MEEEEGVEVVAGVVEVQEDQEVEHQSKINPIRINMLISNKVMISIF